MFFYNRLRNIKETDYVLEIGPGGTPHPRSDILLERNFSSSEAYEQSGHSAPIETDKPIIYFDGDTFPFNDNEFDYVICTHVFEHIPSDKLAKFVSEIQRVAKKGYIEFPTIYYDYIYNFPAHLTFLYLSGDKIYYMPKSIESLDKFSMVQSFFYRTADLGYTSLIKDLKDYLFQGYEWEGKINLVEATTLDQLTYDKDFISSMSMKEVSKETFSEKIMSLLLEFLSKTKKKIKFALNSASTVTNYRFNRAAKEWFKIDGDNSLRINYDLDENSVVFDVGGFQGDFADKIFKKYGSSVYIFEPVPRFYRLLCTRFRNNQKIKIFNFGLSSSDNVIEFFLNSNSSSAIKKSDSSVRADLRNVTSFLSLTQISKINLLKINIEGGEYDLLDELISSGSISCIDNIQVQFHDFAEKAKKRRRKIRRKMRKTHSLTYDYYFIWENWRKKNEKSFN